MDGKTPARYPCYTGNPAPVREEQKSALIAGVCSTVLPGLGQVYNGETAKGFTLFILTGAGLTLGLVLSAIPGLVASITGPIIWLYAIYNAHSTAGKMNRGEIPFREMRMLHAILFVVFAIAVVVVRLILLYVMVVEPLMSQLGTLDSGNFNQLFGTSGFI
jgi:TM2 domain-containing membrane protein YozV